MRFKNVVRNSFFSVLGQIILIILGFCSSRVLNHQMGEALVGVNGVISNILGILSVSELGFSTAVVYHLYRVLEEKEEAKIAALLNLYRKAYQIIALVIFSTGICLLPFIQNFMRQNPFSIRYIRMIYFLWLLRTVLNYLLSYRRSILIADQREYIVSITTMFVTILYHSAVILIILLTKNYIMVLLWSIVLESIASVYLNRYVEKRYPYLKTYRHNRIEKADKHLVFEDMKNIFFSKVALKLLLCTDNLIISGMIGVAVNGLYNNYYMISSSVANLVVAVNGSIQPTMANLFLEKDMKKNYGVFRQISFLYFLISSFACVSLSALMTPFVRELWLGEKFLLDRLTVICLAVCVTVNIMGFPLSIVMAVNGMFRVEKNLSLAASIANVFFSVILVKPIGLKGVIFGTFFSYAFCIVVRAWYFFKEYLHMPITPFVMEMGSYFLLIFLETLFTNFVTGHIYTIGNVWSFFLCCAVCVLLPNGINLALFFRSWRFQSLFRMVRQMKDKGTT